MSPNPPSCRTKTPASTNGRCAWAARTFRLIFDTEPAGDLQTLPLARVIRDDSGHFAYDPHFVPPVVQLGASGPLLKLVQRLIEILDDKSATMSRAEAARSEFATREIANFWLLHAVNSALAPLRHQLVAKRGHPEELVRRAVAPGRSALCTFAPIPPAQPAALRSRESERLLRQARPAYPRAPGDHRPHQCVTIPLRQARTIFYEGEITDQRCSAAPLGLRHPRRHRRSRDHGPRPAARQDLHSAVRARAGQARAARHGPDTPSGSAAVDPARVETQYFGVSRSGPCWDHMVQTRRIGVYVPGEFPDAEVELYVPG